MPTQTEKADYLRRTLRNSGGDDDVRATMAFRGMSDKELDQPFGQSGLTRRQVLQEYVAHRILHDESIAYLESLLR